MAVLFITPTAIKKDTIIEQNVDDKILVTLITSAQEYQLKPIIGNDLYADIEEELIAKSNDSNYTIPEAIETLRTKYVNPFLKFAVAVDFIVTSSYKFSNKGVVKLNDNSATNISPSEMEYLKNYYDNQLTAFKKRLIDYLKENNLLVKKADTNFTSPVMGLFLESKRKCMD